MNYEEKYNEILEWARKNKARLNGVPIEEVLPELAESEDERIRKRLIEYFEGFRIGNAKVKWEGLTVQDVLDWLEKQKEQKPVHFELKAGKWYICHRAFCCRADHLTVKEGERFQCEKDGIVKGFVIKEPEKYFKECSAPAPMEDEQKEQMRDRNTWR